MNQSIGNRDKKIALLLVAAFAWLFIGSLVIFHQEHVLGKHFQMNSKMFISPKSKDKKEYSFHISKPHIKYQDNGIFTGICPDFRFAGPRVHSFLTVFHKDNFLFPEDPIAEQSALRAPPAA